MASEMVERVAHALRSKCAEIEVKAKGDGITDVMWIAETYAQVAIEAMRDPTAAMIIEGLYRLDDDGNYDSREIWRAMIDAALQPT